LVHYLLRRVKGNNPYPPDVALIAGRKSENPWLLSAKTVIRTATPGFFELKQARPDNESEALLRLPERGYLLFIDDCLALSFDFALGDFKPIVSPDRYYQVLNAFFDQVEQATGLPVVVAAHPNGKEYPAYNKLFGGRALFYDRTAILSYGCACAFTHFSSAINYPVLLRKPIAILTFDELRAAPQGEVSELLSSLLQRPLLDMSLPPSEKQELLAEIMESPIEAAYANYERSYIVDMASPGDNPFDNLVNHLKSTRSNNARVVKN
jgi:hypothetical protein